MVPKLYSTTYITFFCPFTPLWNPLPMHQKKSKFWKNEKMQADIISFYKLCMVPKLWSTTDITFFCPLTPPPSPASPPPYEVLCLCTKKNQNSEKMKKCLQILSHFTNVYHKWHSRCMFPEIWSTADIIFCHFGPLFALLPH